MEKAAENIFPVDAYHKFEKISLDPA